MVMIYLNKSCKSRGGVISVLLILFTLLQAVNAAPEFELKGIEAYLLYAGLLILVFTFVLAFINFRNIQYERKLLEEERSELAKQRLRVDEDLVRERTETIQQRERLEKELNAIKKRLDEDRKLLQKAMDIIEKQLKEKGNDRMLEKYKTNIEEEMNKIEEDRKRVQKNIADVERMDV